MSKYRPEHIRNIVLVGQGAAGKTSLADQMLYRAGATTRPGSVDEGTSHLDTDDEERQRHFSISSAMVHFDQHGLRFNVIDTPGYPDFVGQVISAVCAAETACVVIDSTRGVEPGARRMFDLATQAELARVIVLNQLDRESSNFSELLDEVRAAFGRCCVPVVLPAGVGKDFTHVTSTLNPGSAAESERLTALQLHRELLECVVEADEELLERYLEGEDLDVAEILRAVTKAVAAGSLIPVFCVSARTGVGVSELLSGLERFALSPGEVVRQAKTGTGESVSVSSKEELPLVARVFKTRIDPFVSKLSYLRIYQGRVTRDALVVDSRNGRTVKLHQLLDVQGNAAEPVEEAHAGDLVAVAKIDDLQIGDTLTSVQGSIELPSLSYPVPTVGLAVEPKSRSDQQRISGALHRIEEEDPTFRVVRDQQTNELVIQGLSELHLQVVQERLHQRDKVDVLTHLPKVPYRETISQIAEGHYRHKKQSGGAGQFAEVHLRLYPLPREIDPAEEFREERYGSIRSVHYDPDLNFAFLDCVSGGSVPNQFIPAVEKGIRDRLASGVLAGYPIQDIAVALFFGKDHPVDSNEAAFRAAASHCFAEVFSECAPLLLEPIMRLTITAPVEALGDLAGDLNSRRGRIEGLESSTDGVQFVHGVAPLAEVMTYSRTLSSMTGGRGTFRMEFGFYEPVSALEQRRLTATAGSRNGHLN